MNASESFVFKLCQRSFLSLWSYANPKRPNSDKELCDVLIVCAPDIIIISVKENELATPEPSRQASDRWERKAVAKSIKQISGAERQLSTMEQITTHEGLDGGRLPLRGERRIHRIAVALGSRGAIPLADQIINEAYYHVVDEESIEVLLKELDTIVDFVSFLTAKDDLAHPGTGVLVNGGDEQILACYLANGRVFPSGMALAVLDAGLWHEFATGNDYQAWQAANLTSYAWDGLIETLGEFAEQAGRTDQERRARFESITRVMAREPRLRRRLLGSQFLDFTERSVAQPTAVRCIGPKIPRCSMSFCQRQRTYRATGGEQSYTPDASQPGDYLITPE